MKKKLICLIAVLALFAGILPLKAPVFAEDDGIVWNAVDNRYEISNYRGLKKFADIVNGVSVEFAADPAANAILVADFNATDSNWIPIGNMNQQYNGTFDGQGYVIYKLTFNNNTADYVGLFGYIGSNGFVKRVCIDGGSFTGKDYVGGIAGRNEGRILYCNNSNVINGNFEVGGIAGYNHHEIYNSYNKGTIEGESAVGGISGGNYGAIYQCYNYGNISCRSDAGGGIARYNSGFGTIAFCYNVITVTGNANIGAIAGSNQGGIRDCYYDSYLVQNDPVDPNVAALTTAQMTGTYALKNLINFETQQWLVREDRTESDGNHYWYYPHLKGFSYDDTNSASDWPAKVQVKAEPDTASFTYDGQAHKSTVSVYLVGSGDQEILLDETEYTLTYMDAENNENASFADAGDYKVVVNFTSPGHSPVELKYTIAPKGLTIKAENGSKTYGEEDPVLQYTADGLIGGDKISGELSRVQGEAAGEYVITQGALTAGNNYEIEFTGGTFTIAPSKAVVTADDKSKVYDEADPELTATISGLLGNDTYSVISYTLSRTEGENVGTYTITSTGTAVQGNYEVEYRTGVFTISKKTAGVIEPPQVLSGLIYSGSDQTLVSSGEAENGGAILYALGENALEAPVKDSEWSSSIPACRDAGTYYVWYKVAADQNHSKSDAACVMAVIEKADPEVDVPEGLTAEAGQSLSEIELPEGWSWEDNSQTVGEGGSIIVKAKYTPEDTNNYNELEGIEISVEVRSVEPEPEPVPVAAADPVLPEDCEFEESFTVTISCDTEGADIYYTTDGSDPSVSTEAAAVYTGEFEITDTTTVKAFAVKSGMEDSSVVSATYTKKEAEHEPEPTPAPSYDDSEPTYRTNAAEAENGKIVMKPKYAEEGELVTVTVTPDNGYELDTLTVKDKSGNEITLTKNADGAYSFKMPASEITAEAEFKPVETFENPFEDVKEGDYFYDAVMWAVKNGITEGTSPTRFSPNGMATRAQTVTFLWRAAGCPKPTVSECPFNDIDEDAYYYEAVLWAYETGVTDGTSPVHFDPEGTVTRAHTVTFLYRFIRLMGDGFEGTWQFKLDYSDVDEVPEYAIESFCYTTMEGIVEGDNGALEPLDDCLRAQIVTMLYRYFVK